MRGERRAAAAQSKPKQRGGQREHRTVAETASEGTGRDRSNEMVGGEGGREGREHRLRQGRGRESRGEGWAEVGGAPPSCTWR